MKIERIQTVFSGEMVKNDLPQPAKAIWSMSQSKRRLVTCAPLQCKEKRGEQVTNRGLLREGLGRSPEQKAEVGSELSSMISEDRRDEKSCRPRNGLNRLPAAREGELEDMSIIAGSSHLHPIAV